MERLRHSSGTAERPVIAGPGLQVQEARFAWLMISPSLLVLLLIGTAPLVALLGMSVMRIDLAGTQPNAFVGTDNFVRMASDSRFWHSLNIMLVYTVSSVLLQLVVGLALALALLRPIRGQRLLRVAILLPMILAPVVVGLAWRTLILTPDYGIADAIVQALGFGSQPWLTDARWALVSVIAIHTWQWTPFAFLVFTATLHALPQEPFEAAMIDGANAWQRFRDLTLPLLWPTILVIVILRTMIALRAFDAIFSATGGGPGTATEILNLYAYRVSFTNLTLGYGAALAFVLLAVTAVISFALFRLRD
ncbi:MAG: sugar ABC transporter permease [Chloroflexia bacterium]|nr:sugar ABC transporter permease [Chloroflexia bacterium]